MSNPACFLYDICCFKVGDMECMDIVKSEEGLEPHDDNQKVEKLKESHLLLKKKLSLSHELIQQYNDKIKECQHVTTELEAVKESFKKTTAKFNSSLLKITQLELENEDYRQKIANYSKIVPEQQTKIAADQQLVQQLICKVQQLEKKEVSAAKLKKDDSLREKIKSLEAELKASKDSHKSDLTQMEIKIKSIKTAEAVKSQTKEKEVKISHDKGTCTGNELEPVIARPIAVDKCVMTNEFYSVKDDPYPLFCSTCLVKLDPAPLDQIFKHMTCPEMITEVTSPSKESEIDRGNKIPRAASRKKLPEPEMASTHKDSLDQSLDSVQRNSDVSKSDLRRLEEKICSLERKLRKKVKNDVVQERNPCCGFQFPNNCYLGPYPNIFQPGAMIRPQPDLIQFENWQEGLRNRKRSRKSSIQNSNRRGMKARKKRKLDKGTSEWNVDSVPSREFIDSDHTDCSEPLNIPLRTESPPPDLHNCKNHTSKRSKEFSLPVSRKKRGKLAALFTTERSPSPKLHENENPEVHREDRIESPRLSPVINETFSDEEIVPNCSQTPEDKPEHKAVEGVKRKRGRPPKNAPKVAKAPAKCSLVTKIRNLKKNCNKIKPPVAKTAPVNNNANKIASDQTSGATVAVSCIETVKNSQTMNGVDDYCPAKKHRIAHSVRKPENDSLCEGNKNLIEAPKTSIQINSVNDEAEGNTPSETVAIIEKMDNARDEGKKTAKSVFRIERRRSTRDSTDTNSSELAKEPVIKYFKVESVPVIRETAVDTEETIDNISNTSNSVIEKTLQVKKKDILLQPCVMIPKMYLAIKGVEDPCKLMKNNAESNQTEEDESAANLDTNIDQLPGEDPTLKILRSKTKTIESNDTVNAGTVAAELNFHLTESLDPNDTSMSVKSDKSEDTNNEVLEIDKTGPAAVAVRKYKRRRRILASPASPMRELRSRRIILSPKSNQEEDIPTKDNSEETRKDTLSRIEKLSENSMDRSSKIGFGPKALIRELVMKKRSFNGGKKRYNEKLQERKENLVTKELTKLSEDPEWTKPVLLEVIERLSKFKTHTIAKCTINFLVTRADDDEILDKTHTPPAPLLSKTQQRLLTMLVVLNRTMPDIIKLVQAGIEFRLFRLGHAPEVNIIQELARVFTALARIQKDRERVRILCYDALYCLGLKAMPLIYVILVSWPEVFPMAGSSNDPIILCVINSIMTQTGDMNFPKFFSLKKLLTGYYSYESSGYVSDDLAKNLMTSLKDKRQNGLDTAIILLAKRKGPTWTHRNIIQGGLLRMIIEQSHPSIYDAFCLLGYLMRSFPLIDKEGLVKNILEQLCALMESGEGSMQQQEGVATALLSLYRHKPHIVGPTILKWEPSESMSESTSRQLTTLFDNYPLAFWNNLLRKDCVKLTSKAQK